MCLAARNVSSGKQIGFRTNLIIVIFFILIDCSKLEGRCHVTVVLFLALFKIGTESGTLPQFWGWPNTTAERLYKSGFEIIRILARSEQSCATKDVRRKEVVLCSKTVHASPPCRFNRRHSLLPGDLVPDSHHSERHLESGRSLSILAKAVFHDLQLN